MTDEPQPANSLSIVIGKSQKLCHIFKGDALTRTCELYLFQTTQWKENEPENTENNIVFVLPPGNET